MQKDKRFVFSVVMAIYDTEKYLEEAIDSIIEQDIDFKKYVQLILVNDGSNDGSGDICDRYKSKYPENILVIHKENGGAASARNKGLPFAEGELINFMDSDDKISIDVFSKVFEFYQNYKNKTDIISVPLHFFDGQDGEHWQNWKFNRGTRVIDLLEEYSTTIMSTASSFINSRRKNEIIFDDRLATGEDFKVLLEMMYPKLTLGVVADVYYYYRREPGGNSLIQSSVNKKEWYFNFVPHLVQWAYDFYKEKMNVFPAYVQYGLLADLQWRIKEDALKSSILNEKEKSEYQDILYDSLRLFEDRFIISQKKLFPEEKLFCLSKKYKELPSTLHTKDEMYIYFTDEYILRQSRNLFNIYIMDIQGDTINIEGNIRVFPGFYNKKENLSFTLKLGEKEFIADLSENTVNHTIDKNILEHHFFKVKINIKDIINEKIIFLLKSDNTEIEFMDYRLSEFCPISKELRYSNFYFDNKIIFIDSETKHIVIKKCTSKEKRKLRRKYLFSLIKIKDIAAKKAFISRILGKISSPFIKKPIYIVSDRINQANDNGEAFFLYLNKETKIRPFFAISKSSEDFKRLKKIGKVIAFGGWKYKFLVLLNANIISSHAEDNIYNPFDGNIKYYSDLMYRNKSIFLQHGIISDDLSRWLNKYNKDLDIFVTSTKDEYDSIVNGKYNYNEHQVKLTGLPRYDRFFNDKKKIITIFPTWRRYLAANLNRTTGEWILNPDFKDSEFYKFYNTLLNNEALIDTADKYGYTIQFFPHPNFIRALNLYDRNKKVVFLDQKTSYSQIFSESSLMVTDYSSVSFDFAYLKKPLIYSQFDSEVFFSGNHVYDKGYFDYTDHGFGEVTHDLDSTIELIIEYIKNDCKIKPFYLNRIENTFKFIDKNNSKRVHEEILKIDRLS